MSFLSFHKKNTGLARSLAKDKIFNKGFTIAELIIVIAIFALVTSIAMFNQGRLNSNILINNMAFEAALAVREAQVYGIGVRAGGDSTSPTGDTFSGWFGAHFDIANPTDIIIFNDMDKNGAFDLFLENGNTEAKYQYTFTNQRGNKITAICPGPFVAGTTCQNDEVNSVSSMDIIFKRPSPEAHFHIPGGSNGADAAISRAYIVVNNVDNDNCRVVIVESTGQIRVENSDVVQKSCSNSN